MRYLFLLTLFSALCFAQDPVPAPPLPPNENWELYAPSRMSEKIVILLDVSGSMNGGAFGHAITKIQQMLAIGLENCEIKLVKFDDDHFIFTPPDGNSWFELPDKTDRLPVLLDHVAKLAPTTGGLTDPRTAFRHAIRQADDKTCILLISDGHFQYYTAVLQDLAKEQEAKRKASGHIVPVFVFGVGAKNKTLLEIARLYSGWYISRQYREETPADPFGPFHFTPPYNGPR